ASFSPTNVRAYFPSMRKVALRLQGRWEAAARADASIDLQADLMRYTVDTISGLAFGTDVNTLESDDDVIQQHLDKIFPALFSRVFKMFPYWRYVRLPADRQLDRSMREINLAIDGFIASARERLRADPSVPRQPRNLLEAMIVAADEPGSGVDDQDVAGNVMTMLLAGEDTTANTLAWMIHLLYRNPKALERAREEVRRLAPDPAAFTAEQMASLDYLEACANETMRLKPVAPNLPVEAIEDTVVGGVAVPKDTLVWSVLRHGSMDDQYFPNASEFRPERWLEAGAQEQGMNSSKRVAMPFGSGPRVCPGRYLAMLEIKMAMAMLLARFEIASVEAPTGGEAEELLSFTMSPVGLRMRLR
ncbi:MAG: cytochrome P450, partial [Pseudomonadota bacterium]